MTRFLYVGPLFNTGTCQQRLRALKDLGHTVFPVDLAPPDIVARRRTISWRVRRRLFGERDVTRANEQILAALEHSVFDVLWLDKAVTVGPQTLREVKRRLPSCRVAGYFPDDMTLGHNQTRAFLDAAQLYDIAFIHRRHGVDAMRALGFRRVAVVQQGYDRRTHRPLRVSDAEKRALGGAVGHIGVFEEQRARSLHHLASHGVQARAWGPGWRKCRLRHPNLKLENGGQWGDEYAKTICAFEINVGFLRQLHEDEVTSRSFEIPACQGFLLAERTPGHQEQFEEGKEAEFFDSDDELLAKTRYYLAHPDQRRRIAVAGRERCLRSGYSYHDRWREMLREVLGRPACSA